MSISADWKGVAGRKETPTDDRRILVFLHGYLETGESVRERMEPLCSVLLPNTEILYPDSPHEKTWFDMNGLNIDNPNKETVSLRAYMTAEYLDAYLQKICESRNIHPSRVVIGGFSQGATMAYYTALRSELPLGGAYVLSGGALNCSIYFNANPKTLALRFARGELETHEYNGLGQMEAAWRALKGAGFKKVDSIQTFPGLNHGINVDVVQDLAAFVRKAAPSSADLACAPDRSPSLSAS